ncbi:MAG: sensor histidine kinase [bacterium]
MGDFFIYLLYLFYGGAFFAIGVSITSRDISVSQLGIARYLWLLALFGYFHGVHEWMELYLKLKPQALPEHLLTPIVVSSVGSMFVSFVFLIMFGISVLRFVFPGMWYYLHFLSLILILTSIILMISPWGAAHPDYFAFVDLRIRNLIGFPGAIFSGSGLVFFSKTVRDISDKGALNFSGAGISLILYGILTGIIPSGTIIPALGAPVELMRGILAVLILHFIMNALHIFDIERKLVIEERLYRFTKSEKLSSLGKMAAGIAHEINNPLSNVSINVEMIEKEVRDGKDRDKIEERFRAIERNLYMASKITKDLLSFSSDRQLEFESMGIRDIIQNTIDLLGPMKKDYQINMDVNENSQVKAIPWKLEEVMLNILINAMEAMPDDGVIDIKTSKDGDNVVIEISDIGVGIRPEDLDRVLDPFFTTKEVGEGTGLGLSICFGIMETHEGTIEIRSKQGEGTSVTLTLPAGDKNDV